MSNVKQIDLAFKMYSQDYDERYMRDTYGDNADHVILGNPRHYLMPYIENDQIWQCPSRNDTTAYWENCVGVANASLAQITQPASTVLVCEGTYWLDTYWKPNSYPAVAVPGGVNNRMQSMQKHNGGLNFGYCDGHVKWARCSQVMWWQFSLATSGADMTSAVGPS